VLIAKLVLKDPTLLAVARAQAEAGKFTIPLNMICEPHC
jgi:hypothetical protein